MSAARGINVRWYESVDHWGEGVCKIVFEVGVSLQVMQDIDTLPVSSSQRKIWGLVVSCNDLLQLENGLDEWVYSFFFRTGNRDEAKRRGRLLLCPPTCYVAMLWQLDRQSGP